MVLLQAGILAQERSRLNSLRQNEQDRANRFMNSKNRSIGIDKSYLDKQMEEKRQLELTHSEEKIAEAENMKHLVQCLDNSEAAALEVRRKHSFDVRKSLDEQTRHKNKALGKDGPLDLDKCGPSSLQCFSGEDHAYETRKKAQQQQVKLWCAEYMVEKHRALDAERKEEQDYTNYVLEQERIRSELEQMAHRKKEGDARLRQFENMEYARQGRERKEKELEADKTSSRLQSHYLQTCPLLTEDTALAINANAAHRFRPDHFKGFQKDQVNQIYKENENQEKEKRRLCTHEADTEADWANYHAEVVTKMSDAEETKQVMIAAENRVHRGILAKQREELVERKTEIENERLAEIGSDFFMRFGQSCR